MLLEVCVVSICQELPTWSLGDEFPLAVLKSPLAVLKFPLAKNPRRRVPAKKLDFFRNALRVDCECNQSDPLFAWSGRRDSKSQPIAHPSLIPNKNRYNKAYLQIENDRKVKIMLTTC